MSHTYEGEVRARWGTTDAYREHTEKTGHFTQENWEEVNKGLQAIFANFATCKSGGASANSFEAQALVSRLQLYITTHYYRCTLEILAGLGKMYIGDPRFQENIDKCGEGVAEYVAEAIAEYCKT
jgi:hypothetical protein